MAYQHHKPLPELTLGDIQRFWKFVRKGAQDECWPWIGGRNKRGYGNFWMAGKTVTASRVAFFLHHRYDSFPLFAMHTCDNKPCCNGAHLKPGTNQQNTFDAWKRIVEPNRGPYVLKARNERPGHRDIPVLPRTQQKGPEGWRKVVGYECLYEVSNYGRVRNLKASDRWPAMMVMRAGQGRNGYLRIALSAAGRSVKHLVHRLVAAAFLGASEEDVNHKDGHKNNCVLDNLEYLTDIENCEHSKSVLQNWPAGLRNGKYTKPEATPRGASHGMSKLSEDQVREIKRLHATGLVSGSQLAREYEVEKYTIYSIIHGRTWRHVS